VLGARSLLRRLPWAEISPALAAAKTHAAASDLSKQAEKEYRDRDCHDAERSSGIARRARLVANRKNPKALGDFGYVVDDSPQAKAKPSP
jgi:hypothetical protein